MPSEIEKIAHQSPYAQPQQLPGFDDAVEHNQDAPRELLRDMRALRDQLEAYQIQLHAELTESFSELSACVNTLFDRFNRLPILPEVTTPTDNRLDFTDEGSGVVSIDSGQQWVMRGNLVVDTDDFTTEQRQFTTTASKTYHVRWDATNGLRYIDTTDATYNPSALPATHMSFNSTSVDVLLQTIDTDGSNVPTFSQHAITAQWDEAENAFFKSHINITHPTDATKDWQIGAVGGGTDDNFYITPEVNQTGNAVVEIVRSSGLITLTQGGNSINIRIGTVAPTASDPNGSIAVNINGAAGAVLYVREAGAWAAK